MSFIISAPSSERRSFKPVPAGSHIAICTTLVDVGLQPAFEPGGNPQHKIYVGFDIPAERIEMTDADGNPTDGPAKIGIFLTKSMHEKAKLRALLSSWRGKALTDADVKNFDLTSILGKPCMLSVAHRTVEDKTYANILGISGLPKGMPAPTLEGAITLFPDAKNADAFERLPEFLRKKIDAQLAPPPPRSAPARAVAHAPSQAPAPAEEFDDAIPF